MTRNEERRLPRAFDSLPSHSQILVVDAESIDGTVSIARGRGARTIVRPWEGFCSTRRFALQHVRTAWTFMLDADESLDDELRAALTLARPGDDLAGYTVTRRTSFCGRPMRGLWGAERLVRLFRTSYADVRPNPAARSSADVHERWTVRGRLECLAGTLEHDSYPTLHAYWEKFRRYTDLEADGAEASLRQLTQAAVLALGRVPWLLLARGGWRDGWRGWFVAVGSAAYPVAVAWKALRRAHR